MPQLPPDNTARVVYNWAFEGRTAASVFHVQFDPTDTLQSVADVFIDAYSNLTAAFSVGLQSYVVNDMTLTTLEVSDLAEVGQGDLVVAVNGPGAAAGDPLPYGCSLTIKWLTGRRGKSFRGRTYLFGLDTGNIDNDDNGVWDTGAVSDLTTWATELIAALQTNTTPLAIVSRFTGGNERPQAIRTLVTSAASTRQVNTIRRRNRITS